MTTSLLLCRWLGPALVLAVVAAGLLGWGLLPAAVLETLLSEEGPVERASAALYFVAAPALLLLRGAAGLRRALALVALAFGLRELDLHKALTGTSMLRLSYYASGAPSLVRLAAGAVLLAVAAALLWLALRGRAPLLRALRSGDAAACTALTFIVVLVVSKLLDRSLNALHEWFGVVWPASAYALQAAIEEPGELALPLLMLLAVAQQRAAYAKAVSTPV